MSRPPQRLLPLILLAPLLAVVAMAALNLRPAVSLRLLIWTSPALPLGSWLALAVGGGGLLSAAATSAALQSGVAARRQVRLKAEAPGRRQEYAAWDPAHGETASRETAGQGNASGGNSSRDPANRQNLGWEANDWNAPPAASAAPPRPPGAPPPTVEVPFRVIRKPAKNASAQPDSQPPKAAKASASANANANANANGGDGWDESSLPDDNW